MTFSQVAIGQLFEHLDPFSKNWRTCVKADEKSAQFVTKVGTTLHRSQPLAFAPFERVRPVAAEVSR
jgi:hypothetical protein